MLRWTFLLLLLANALLFFWFAQQHVAPAPVEMRSPGVARLKLLSELGPGEVLPARQRVCLVYAPLSSQAEAQSLVQLLDREQVSAEAVALPPQAEGYRLSLSLPADSDRRVKMLDELAAAGWVPESHGSEMLFGHYASRETAQAAHDSLPDELKAHVSLAPEFGSETRYEVHVSHLVGYEISSEINGLIESSWPGVKIEKKPCEGVASPRGDQ